MEAQAQEAVVSFLLPRVLHGINSATAEGQSQRTQIEPVLREFVAEWLHEAPAAPHDPSQLAELSEMLAAYLDADVGRVPPAGRAEALGVELIRRRLARLSTQCYVLEQQMATGGGGDDADAAAARAQTAAQQLRAAIQRIGDPRVASRLQDELRQIVNSAIFVFGFGGMHLG